MFADSSGSRPENLDDLRQGASPTSTDFVECSNPRLQPGAGERRPMMKIVLRADVSRLVGVGHVMRSMTLGAAAVERGHAVELRLKTLPTLLSGPARDLGIELVEVIAAGTPYEADGILKLMQTWICLDGYDSSAASSTHCGPPVAHWMAIDNNREMPLDHIDVILDRSHTRLRILR